MSKTILITGCSSGIGKAAALYFHSKGWNVAATMRNPDLVDKIEDSANIIYPRLDVTDVSSIREATRTTIDTFGRIDVLVNNAAYSLTGPFEAATAKQIEQLYDVDVFGLMNVTREILPHFREMHSGMIINISSLGGRIGMPFSCFYASAKWAVEGFSEALQYELSRVGVRMKIVEPGAINTRFANNAIIVRKNDVPAYKEAMEKRLTGYEKRRDRLDDPMVVVKEIYRAVNDGKSKLRYIAGNDARLFWFLKNLLPEPVFTALLKRMAG